MLPPFIIEQIRKREEERRKNRDAPRLELPLPLPPSRRPPASEDDADRGVIIVDLGA